MVTPVISCDIYDYEVFNEDSSLNESGVLSVFNESVYYFNFGKDLGTYLIKLCDNTTREIYVRNDEVIGEMAWLAISLVIILMSAIFFYASHIIKNEKLQMVKILFFIYGVVNLFLIALLPYVISLNPTDSTIFNPLAEGYIVVNGLGLVAFVFMYGYHLIITIGQNKKEKNE
jgi:hypothetical protein